MKNSYFSTVSEEKSGFKVLSVAAFAGLMALGVTPASADINVTPDAEGTGLATLNKMNTDEVRNFNFTSADETYTVYENFGTTTAGTLNINGVISETAKSIIDMNQHSGFNINSGTAVNISNVEFKNAYTTSDGAVLRVWRGQDELSITNVDFTNNVSETSTEYNNGGAILITGTNTKIKDIIGNFTENGAISTGTKQSMGGAIGIYSSDGNSTITIDNIKGNFIGNYGTSETEVMGGAIYNGGNGTSIINSITGDFIGNAVSSTGTYAVGGAIDNRGTISDISGNFIDNTSLTTGTFAYGAIDNSRGTIGDITGNFVGNSAIEKGTGAYGASGGGILNFGNSSTTATINSIVGNFTNNYTQAVGRASSGAIDNNNYSQITEGIKGNFTGNYALSTGDSAAARGGAIYNLGTIGGIGIVGDFKDNYAQTNGTFAIGGAIANNINSTSGSITSISGNFTNNRAISTGTDSENSYAQGGAIYNISEIGNIISTFTSNYVSSTNSQAQGGAIYNTGVIGNIINSSFVNNYASSKSSTAQGGAIYSTKDINITAKDGYTSVFSGNYTIEGETKDQNAIYMDTKEGSENAVLTLNANTNGKFILDDNINGKNYTIDLTGDSTGKIYINNNILNADIQQSNATSYLNEASQLNYNNSLNISSGIMNINHLGMEDVHFRSFSNNGTINLNSVDINPATETMGRLTADSYDASNGTFNVNGLNVLADPIKDKTNVLFADKSFANTVKYHGSNEYMGKIYKYSVGYLPDTGEFQFIRGGGSSGSGAYNPSILVTGINTQAGTNATVSETFKYVFEHADAFTQLPSLDRFALMNDNKYALSTDYNNNLGITANEFNNKAGWFRPYVTFEKMNLKNSPAVNATTYGSLAGFDSDFQHYRHGWTGITTGYIGYNGSQLRYSGADTTMNGGLLGATQTFYKDNFWTALTLSAGASAGQSTTMYGKEDFTTLFAGIGSKTGYNFEFKNGRYIIQPIWFMSYTFGKTFDYTNAAGVRIDSDPMHSIMLNPSVRFIMNTKDGWQPYASVGMVWNAMNESNVTANGVTLPEASIKPYVEYGLGVQKRFKDKYTAFGQAMIRNGGRNGIALTLGFRYKFGNDGKTIKHQEKVSLPQTKVTLNGLKDTQSVAKSTVKGVVQATGQSVKTSNTVESAKTANVVPERKIIKQMTQQQKVSLRLIKPQNTSLTTHKAAFKQL